jgi:NTP pyrophosphatase (non-canonical NTP hydrolase)
MIEVGSIAGVKKENMHFIPGEGPPPPGILADNLGNVLQYVALIAHFYNIPLEDIARHQVLKLETLSK